MTYLRVKKDNPYFVINFNSDRGRISNKNLIEQLKDINIKYESHKIVSACIFKDFKIKVKTGEASKLQELISILETLPESTHLIKCEIAFKEI